MARASGWSAKEAGELSLLVIELCTNADRHGGGGNCSVELTSVACDVTVEDDGPGFSPELLARFASGLPVEDLLHPPGARAERGLGAGLDAARRLATRLTLENRPDRGAAARARVERPARRAGR